MFALSLGSLLFVPTVACRPAATPPHFPVVDLAGQRAVTRRTADLEADPPGESEVDTFDGDGRPSAAETALHPAPLRAMPPPELYLCPIGKRCARGEFGERETPPPNQFAAPESACIRRRTRWGDWAFDYL
jgi:hypothetical protein